MSLFQNQNPIRPKLFVERPMLRFDYFENKSAHGTPKVLWETFSGLCLVVGSAPVLDGPRTIARDDDLLIHCRFSSGASSLGGPNPNMTRSIVPEW
jgi:hypothetical protein